MTGKAEKYYPKPSTTHTIYTFTADAAVKLIGASGMITSGYANAIRAIIQVEQNDIRYGFVSDVSGSGGSNKGYIGAVGQVITLHGYGEIDQFYACNRVAGANAKLQITLET